MESLDRLAFLSQGSGGYGSVYEGLWRGRRVAVKCLPKDGATNAQFEALIREIDLSAKFDSRRLVQVYGACLDSTSTICLIMELVEGGNLYQLIHHSKHHCLTLVQALEARKSFSPQLLCPLPLIEGARILSAIIIQPS